MNINKTFTCSASSKSVKARCNRPRPAEIAPRRPPGPMNHQQYQRDLEEDRARLRRLLRRALKDSALSPSASGEVRILNLACGSCNEAEVLVETLPELLLKDSGKSCPPPAALVGIDVREREISDALARCRSWLKSRASRGSDAPLPQFEFLAGDATRVKTHREIGDDFDVVFLRHQNFYDGADTWRKIFDQGLEKLSPEGYLIFTSYFDREHKLALKAFESLGGEIIVSRENPSGRKLSTPGKVVDKHIAVVRAAR